MKHAIRICTYLYQMGVSMLSFSAVFLVLPATMSRASWIATIVGCIVAGVLYLARYKKIKTYITRFRKKTL